MKIDAPLLPPDPREPPRPTAPGRTRVTLFEAAHWKTALASAPGGGLPTRFGAAPDPTPLPPPSPPKLPAGKPLTAIERQQLAARLGAGLLRALTRIQVRPRLQQMDAMLALTALAGHKTEPSLRLLAALAGLRDGAGIALAHLLDTWIPLTALARNHAHPMPLDTLLERGVPPGSLAVLVCERHAADGAGGHALVVLAVDRDAGHLICLDLSAAGGEERLRKIDIPSFRRQIEPRTLGGIMAIPTVPTNGAPAA